MSRRLLLAALVGALCSFASPLRAEKPMPMASVPPVGYGYPVPAPYMPYATDGTREPGQVAVEVRFLAVTDQVAEKLGLTSDSHQPRFLSEEQLWSLMGNAQNDMNTNIMQAPKTTLMDGQTSILNVGDTQTFETGITVARNEKGLMVTPTTTAVATGTTVSLKTDISADRRAVNVNIEATLSDLADGPVEVLPVGIPLSSDSGAMRTQYIKVPVKVIDFHVAKKILIPDGRTVMLGGQKTPLDIHEEYRAPWLADLPYVGKFFIRETYRKGTGRTYMFVTPRIIEGDKKEQHANAYPDHWE